MNIFDLTEDSVMQIVNNMDIVSFIFFMSTCKHFYDLRKVCIKFVSDTEAFKHYSQTPLISMLMNSYLVLTKFRDTECEIIGKLPSRIEHDKIRNTMTIMGYYCEKHPTIYEYHHTCNTTLLEICCKSVCRKYRYKYTRPYHRLYRLFWCDWYLIGVNMIDICELVYHIKNRKYRHVYDTLMNLKFRLVNKQMLYDTVKFVHKYMELEDKKEFNACMIYLIYAYFTHDINVLKDLLTDKVRLKKVVMEKAKEHIFELRQLQTFPTYLKEFMANNIKHCYDCVAAA